MAIERELKLALPGDLPAARADALIAHLDHLPGAEARGERHLVNRYFDTPSLALVAGTAPYFHDGRYRSLRALLLDCDGKMGSTSGLSPADLDALEVYLGTL